MKKLLSIIPKEEDVLREALKNSEIPEETLLAAIGHPTHHWHWEALHVITGKSYDQLKQELGATDADLAEEDEDNLAVDDAL